MKIKHLGVYILCAVLLNACAGMKDIFPRAKTINANDLEVGKIVKEADLLGAWPSEDWWKVYGDPQLDALIQKGLAENPTVKIAIDRVMLSQSVVENRQAQTMPSVNADASLINERFTSLQFIPPPYAGNTEWNNKVTISLAYDLDFWGRQSSLWKGAIDESRANYLDAQKVKLELVTAIVQNYIQLSMAYAVGDVEEERAALIKEKASILRRELSAGLNTNMALSEVEADLPLVQAKIEKIDEYIAILKNQLAALTAQGSGGGERIIRPIITLSATFALPSQLPANLIARRPDVLACRWRVEAAGENIKSAKAEFYPNINLISFIGFQALGFSQLLSNSAAVSGVGPAFSLPLFDGGRRRSNLAMKTTQYDIAVDSYNAILIRAFQEISDQLVILKSNANQKEQTQNAFLLTQKSYALAEASYRAGLENYQRILRLKAVMLDDKERLVRLEAQKLEVYASLMSALGGGMASSNDSQLPVPRAND